METAISETLKQLIPSFKVGVITYHDIVVSDSPQLIKGKLAYFKEALMLELEEKTVGELSGVAEWRQIFKTIGTDPSRYRPSQEALLRRFQKGQAFPFIHSAADINNYFSARFEIPMGIYDLDNIKENVMIRIGTSEDVYEGINGRQLNMSQKIISADQESAFGSPIVDSKRTMTTPQTRNALQIVYLKPSENLENSHKLLKAISELFVQVNGGEASYEIIE